MGSRSIGTFWLLCLCCLPWLAAASTPTAVVLEIRGAIGPTTASYVRDGLAQAAEQRAQLVVLQMDTPGGLDGAMREIIKAVLASPVPVVSYVAPSGSRAASAGTYILYASHIAAMAPATNLGAATPVQIGGLPGVPSSPPGQPERQPDGEEGQPAPLADPMKHKLVNDAAAYLRGLARLRGRNEDWAEQAVRSAASLSAEEALEARVVDLVAADLLALLRQLHGREVKIGTETVTLETETIIISRFEQDWRDRLLSVITNPNVAYLLMLIGVYGLIFELSNPGQIVPGVIGAIALLLALFAFQALPVNYAGVALILLGISFMVAEAFLPSFGILGLGGVVAFVAGSIMLLDGEGLAISIPLIAGTTLVSAGFSIWVLGMLFRLRRKPVVSGAEELLGSEGETLADFTDGSGAVWVHSERWNARCPQALVAGQSVRVTGLHGLILQVEPIDEER